MTETQMAAGWTTSPTASLHNTQKGPSVGIEGDMVERSGPELVSDTDAGLPPALAAERTAAIQRGRPFSPGRSGNPAGRPLGAKNKLTEVFMSALANDFAEHGAEAIARVRRNDPASYLKLVSSIIPRELVVAREQEPPVDYADLTYEEAGALVEAERKRKLIQKALDNWQ